jgi:hypothetical protein
MTFPQWAQFTDVALFLLRFMVGLVFITSGYNHLKDPAARSEDIGMSKSFTIFLVRLNSRAASNNFGRSRATRRHRFNFAYARRHPEENIYLAHWLLGQIGDERLELRHHARRCESGYRHHRRRKPCTHAPVQIKPSLA